MRCSWGFEFENGVLSLRIAVKQCLIKSGLCCEFWEKGLRANLVPKKKKKHVSMIRCHLTAKLTEIVILLTEINFGV